ncbi:MAG TPA: maleylpyruvate isomerase N-terminal domain-containing protein [bacterium]|nr:maleylpyruvate isomerase N-terminal domain-containing protein [bacterium]
MALLERERRQLERYLFKSGTSAFKLSRAQFTQTGVMNDWSVKDILAWLVSWERGLLAWLRAPTRRITSAGGKDDDDLLEPETFRRLRRRPLDDVIEEYRESSKSVMRMLGKDSGVVSDIVALNLVSRYSRARLQIRKWLKEQTAAAPAAPSHLPAPALPRSRTSKHRPRR